MFVATFFLDILTYFIFCNFESEPEHLNSESEVKGIFAIIVFAVKKVSSQPLGPIRSYYTSQNGGIFFLNRDVPFFWVTSGSTPIV